MKKCGMLVISIMLLICLLTNGFCEEPYLLTCSYIHNIEYGKSELRSCPGKVYVNKEVLFYDNKNNNHFWSTNMGEMGSIVIFDADIDAEGYRIMLSKTECSEAEVFQNNGIQFWVWNEDSYYVGRIYITTIPLLNISIDNDIGNEYTKAAFELYNNQTCEMIHSYGIIKQRGITTREYPKKGYRIQLTEADFRNKRKLALLDMRKDDDWILYAAYNDQEKIRNVFCSNLWEETCARDNKYRADAGCEYKYIELFINAEYWGLYALGYPIDNKQMFVDDDCENGAIFKKNSWDSELDSISNRGDPVSGYELYKKAGIYSLCSDNESWKLLFDFYVFFKENREKTDALAERIDIENAANLYLFLNLVQGLDNTSNGSMKNIMLCLRRMAGGEIQALYAPWDLDYSLGNCFVDDSEQNKTIPYGFGVERNVLFENTYIGELITKEDHAFSNFIKRKWIRLRQREWSDNRIINRIEHYEKQIYDSGAFVRDKERWPNGNYNRAEERLSVVKEYILLRLEICDGLYMNNY